MPSLGRVWVSLYRLTAPATPVQANGAMDSPDWPQVIRQTFKRWSEGDRRFDPELMHPDIEIHSVAGLLTGRAYRGREGLEQWERDITESFDEWTIEADEFDEPTPGRVLAVGRVHFRGRESGISIDEPCAWVIAHEDGLVTSFEVFMNAIEEARAAAASG
jgi:ketosteroid isomerase-like protein